VNENQYDNRALVEGYPDLQRLGSEYFAAQDDNTAELDISEVVAGIEALIHPRTGSRVAVIGCGPNPSTVRQLVQQGYDAVGIEPIDEFVALARAALGDTKRIIQGSAEDLPFESGSQQVIWMDKVIEHVDSVEKSLAESYRALAPGGILYVQTSCRTKFSIVGYNDEFRVRFYNWFPDLLKECYIFSHLHYKPHLANFTVRPAVHWFTYADLCRYGREAGFAQFYSFLDVLPADSPRVKKSRGRRLMFWLAQRSIWMKALALSQFGGTIFMWKRGCTKQGTC
jgi:SAM-dependent methyltransferase